MALALLPKETGKDLIGVGMSEMNVAAAVATETVADTDLKVSKILRRKGLMIIKGAYGINASGTPYEHLAIIFRVKIKQNVAAEHAFAKIVGAGHAGFLVDSKESLYRTGYKVLVNHYCKRSSHADTVIGSKSRAVGLNPFAVNNSGDRVVFKIKGMIAFTYHIHMTLKDYNGGILMAGSCRTRHYNIADGILFNGYIMFGCEVKQILTDFFFLLRGTRHSGDFVKNLPHQCRFQVTNCHIKRKKMIRIVKIFLKSRTKLQNFFGLCQNFTKLSYFCTTKNKILLNFSFPVMRKSTYRASAAIIAFSAILASCSKQDNGTKSENQNTITPAATVATDSTGARPTALATYIRYVDTQRILMEYTLAREVAKTDSTAQIQLAALQNQLSSSLNNRAQQIQEKLQRNGYINESAYNADMTSLQKAQQDAENRMAQRQRDYAADMMTKQAQLHDSIKSVIDDICREQKFDAILNEQAGLYFNPSLDITDIVVAELNRRYKPAK